MHFTKDELDRMERRREEIRAAAESICLEARSAGREHLNQGEARRIAQAKDDLRDLDHDILEYRQDLERSGIPEKYAHLGGSGRQVSSAGRLAPLGHSDEQLRRAFDQLHRGESTVLETRDFSPLAGLVPADLGPILPVFPRHENRLLSKLPGVSIDVPQIAYIEVDDTQGDADIVAEGGPKPELVMPATQKVATARKIAAHVGISWEAYSGDYPAFVSAVQTELMRKLTDCENAQLFGGTGEAMGQVNGIAVATGTLSLDASTITTQPGPWDAIEQGIEMLRSGPCLAEPDLMLVHPTTWSLIRRATNTYGEYYVAADPSTSEVNTAWGIPVVVSTQFTAGLVVLLDSTLYGRVVVREGLVTRIGYSGTDFTSNIIRFVSEERLTQTIERPKAICLVKNVAAGTGGTRSAEKK